MVLGARDDASIMQQEPRGKDSSNDHNPKGQGVSICFQCTDALALYLGFTAKGVTIKEPFVGNNRWVVNFSDPDGYRLDFESLTEIPEETTYREWLKSVEK